MTGPLAPLFAQLATVLERAGRSDSTLGWDSPGGYCPCCEMADDCHTDDCEISLALAALSSIERNVQDMNTALLDIESVASHAVEYGYLHADEWREVLDSARAALPASNGGPDGPAGTPEGVAREKEEETFDYRGPDPNDPESGEAWS